MIASSDATTGSTRYPVMKVISSMAKMLVGSVIASVRVAPVLFTGMTLYLRARSTGMIFATLGSISK